MDGIVFDPEADYKADSHKYMRLPTRYNADIGLYVFNSNRWQVDGSLKVVHYTLGSFKPWDWWCGWLIEEQARWNVRTPLLQRLRLNHTQAEGTPCLGGGSTQQHRRCSVSSAHETLQSGLYGWQRNSVPLPARDSSDASLLRCRTSYVLWLHIASTLVRLTQPHASVPSLPQPTLHASCTAQRGTGHT